MSDLVDALLTPVQPTVDVHRAMNGRDGWDRAEAPATADGSGVVAAAGLRGPSREALNDDDTPAPGKHAVHGVALLPAIADQHAMLHDSAGAFLTDVLRRGLMAVAMQLYRDRALRILKALVRESMEGVLVAFTNRAIEGTVQSCRPSHGGGVRGRQWSRGRDRERAPAGGPRSPQRARSRRRRPRRAHRSRSSCAT